MIQANIYTVGSGAVYAILAALSFAIWNIYLQRAINQGIGPKLALVTLNLTVVIVFLPVALLMGWLGALPAISAQGAFYYCLAGLMTAAMGPFNSNQATRRIGVTRTTALRLLDPFFAFVIASLVLGERLGGQVLTGIILIISALVLLQLDRKGGIQEGERSVLLRGSAFGVAASMSFTLGSVGRKAGLALLPSPLVGTLIEGIVGLAVSLPTLTKKADWTGLRATFSTKHQDLWISALGSAAGTLFLNLALQRVPVPVAVALRNTSPWFVLILAPLIIGQTQRAGRWIWASTGLLTAGMLLIVLR